MCVRFGIQQQSMGFFEPFQHGVWRMLHSVCMVEGIHVYCPVAGIG